MLVAGTDLRLVELRHGRIPPLNLHGISARGIVRHSLLRISLRIHQHRSHLLVAATVSMAVASTDFADRPTIGEQITSVLASSFRVSVACFSRQPVSSL